MKFKEFILPLCFFISGASKVQASCSERYLEKAYNLLAVGGIPSSSTVLASSMSIAVGTVGTGVIAPMTIIGSGVSAGIIARGVRMKRLGLALAIAEGNHGDLNEREFSLGQRTLNKLVRKVNRHSSRPVSYDEVVNILRPASLNNSICHQHDRLKGTLGIKKFILDQIEE